MSQAESLRSVTLPKGFKAAGGTCGIKPSGKPDLCLIVSDSGRRCVAAGVFTRSVIVGAPVRLGRRHLAASGGEGIRAIVCNSGIANVATGAQGDEAALSMCHALASEIGCEPSAVLPASTGVIGRPLPIEPLRGGIAATSKTLQAGPDADRAVARAILTTDLVPKSASRTHRDGYVIGGITKGSGMIAPAMGLGGMATLLAFITTDATLSADQANRALEQAVRRSFNRISVDTDTSTSDSVYLLANGASGVSIDTEEAFEDFTQELTGLCDDLAQQIIRDGEGATKVFAVRVINAANEQDADAIGRAVAESPLVKTAVHGGDPNWGRLAMAVGKARRYDGVEIDLDPSRLVLSIGDTVVYRDEVPIDFTPGVEKHLESAMAGPDVSFTIDLHRGDRAATWYGCDLSREYIRINADYTT